jgi:hypothetical protein
VRLEELGERHRLVAGQALTVSVTTSSVPSAIAA